MSTVLGEVIGDKCPYCNADLEIEGEFFEGNEFTCPACEKLCVISLIEATYVVYMEKAELEEE